VSWLIIISILVVGWFITKAFNKNNDLKIKELEIRQSELEASPDYRKKVGLEKRMESELSSLATYDLFEEANERTLTDAKEDGDVNTIREAEEAIKETELEKTKIQARYEKLKAKFDGISE
jgi:hypothetical protein